MEPIILHGDMSLIRFGGVVSVEIIQPGNMLRPWRYDYTLKDFFDIGLQFMAAHLSGSRIHLKTSSSKIRVIAKNLSNTSICDYDCYVNKQFVATKISTGKNVINAHGVEYNGKEMMRERYRVSQLTMADLVDEDFHTIEFDLSPYISEGSNHMNDVEIWLPHTNSIYLKDILINNHSKIQKPLKDGRPKFITHGSSITHAIAGDATTSVRGRGTGGSPSKSWPGTCARVCDFNLTNLGFGGQCHMDNSVARTIRDLPADFIALKLGINTHNMATFGIRGFSQAAYPVDHPHSILRAAAAGRRDGAASARPPADQHAAHRVEQGPRHARRATATAHASRRHPHAHAHARARVAVRRDVAPCTPPRVAGTQRAGLPLGRPRAADGDSDPLATRQGLHRPTAPPPSGCLRARAFCCRQACQ